MLASLKPASVDAVVTDPPYGIGWQNEHWDGGAIREAAARIGRERLTPNEAFEVWTGLWAAECARVMKPGAHLLAFGAARTFHRLACGLEDAGLEVRDVVMWLYGTGMSKSRHYPGGRATTLKPAFEPVILARKPLAGTTEETIERFGTGALNTEACRVGSRHPADVVVGHEPGCEEGGECAPGCAVALLDAEAYQGRSSSGQGTAPSRWMYCPKVSRAEREAGCEELPARVLDLFPNAGPRPSGRTRNPHPTVKPLALMRWLVRLVCPPEGVVLDPFMGSGTTGAAAMLERRRFCGIEMEPAYLEIAAARIEHWAKQARREPGPLGGRSR
ncbi:MAG TPA: site-specific DNA-methyltransferase [Solirubrobacterales bacterium]|nr:site-specific DNA-methyltransferase [Solirubrobacterales bacterium]